MSVDDAGVPLIPKPVELTPVPEPLSGPGGLRVQHLMFAVVLCALLVWLTMVMGAWILFFGILAVFIGSIGLTVVLARRGSTQQESLLWALAIAAERSQPLAPAALAFSGQFSGGFRARVQIFAALLEQGVSVPDALDEVGGLLNPEAELLVRVGATTGSLPHALRVAAAGRVTRQTAWGGIATRFAYLTVVLMKIQVVTAFIVYFIAPKYEAIFKDFGVALPQMTVTTLTVSHFLIRYFPLFLLLLVAEVVVFMLIPLGLFGVFRVDVPLIDVLFRRRHSALILRSLALTTEGGRPIPEGISVLARDYPSGWAKRRLRRVALEVERGADWIEQLTDNGLIRHSDEAVLASAQRAGNLPWALAEMAEANERRLGYRLQFWLQMLFPLLVVALGALVFVVAVAYFSPIVRLIEVLS